MNNEDYEHILQTDIKKMIYESLKPNLEYEKRKLTNKEKDDVIQKLQDELHRLKIELNVTNRVKDRYIEGLVDLKNKQMDEMLQNPILKFPSGCQVRFNDLNSEQLEYLEKLSHQSKKI